MDLLTTTAVPCQQSAGVEQHTGRDAVAASLSLITAPITNYNNANVTSLARCRKPGGVEQLTDLSRVRLTLDASRKKPGRL